MTQCVELPPSHREDRGGRTPVTHLLHVSLADDFLMFRRRKARCKGSRTA